eukprot:3878797-Amphidinium_carterae.2
MCPPAAPARLLPTQDVLPVVLWPNPLCPAKRSVKRSLQSHVRPPGCKHRYDVSLSSGAAVFPLLVQPYPGSTQ